MTYLPNQYKILDIKKITQDVKLFRIKTKMNPRPGQFFEVSVLGVGECPLASCSYNSDYIDILVRNAGSVTNLMFNLKKGDFLYIRGPYGRGFPLKKMQGKDLIFVAGGTGIAPVTSLIEYIEKRRKNFGKIEIYFGFRNKDYILLKDKIRRWQKKFKMVISLDICDSRWKGDKGFLKEILLKHKPNVKKAMAFLCGPEIMMKTSTEALNHLGLDNNKIYWSLERRMECGFGNCGRCLIQDVYVCKDGPVFRYDFIKPKLDNEEDANKEK